MTRDRQIGLAFTTIALCILVALVGWLASWPALGISFSVGAIFACAALGWAHLVEH